MQQSWPYFKSDFLNAVTVSVRRRSRGLSHHAKLKYEANTGPELEPFAVFLTLIPSPILALHVREDFTLTLSIKNNMRRRRGATLFLLPEVIVVGSPSDMVETFEWTAAQVYGLAHPPAPEVQELIRTRWAMLAEP